MTLTIEHDDVTRILIGKDRYVLIEADGKRAGYVSYVQRPSAERHARSAGLGVYDSRERELIVEPDSAKRIERLSAKVLDAERTAEETRTVIERIEALS